MRILGVDPGLHITGYCCVSLDSDESISLRMPDARLLEAGVLRTKADDPIEKRLAILYQDFSNILDDFQPEVVAIEDLYSHYKNPRTAIIMGHARGTIIAAAGIHNIGVVPYAPNRIKKSLTGNGHASKEQVQRMVMNLLNLSEPPSPPDVADALAAALCHANVMSRQTVRQ